MDIYTYKTNDTYNWYSKNPVQTLDGVRQLISIKTNQYNALVNMAVLITGAFLLPLYQHLRI